MISGEGNVIMIRRMGRFAYAVGARYACDWIETRCSVHLSWMRAPPLALSFFLLSKGDSMQEEKDNLGTYHDEMLTIAVSVQAGG